MPEVGKVVPYFEARTASGEIFRFPTNLQKPFTIFVIYRKNACTPCKAQLIYLRDAYSGLLTDEAQIITLSFPPPEETDQVGRELKLPYTMLCDTDGTVLKLLGAINTEKLISTGYIHSGLIFPTILIVDQKGTVLYKLVTKKTASEQEFAQVKTALEKLRSSI